LLKQTNKKQNKELGMVAHTYNPSVLESKDREECGSRPDPAKSYWEPFSIN
jgi:hypothetical protein